MKEIEWSKIYGEGKVVCSCDRCTQEVEFEFENNTPDYKSVQNEIRKLGWLSCKVQGKWRDFCCEKCRNEFIKDTV